MGETFYTVLGVDATADEETIRRAYREHVKETHPDVSDDPDATRRFQRLTTARDVLSDEKKRRRYDELGHDTYVRRHVETPAWTPGTGDGHTTGRQSRTRRRGSAERTHWRGHDERQQRRPRGRPGSGRQSSARSDGGYASEPWQTASDVYTRSETYVDDASSVSTRTAWKALRTLGPWLVVHLVLLGSTLATVGFVYADVRGESPLSAVTFGGSVLLVSLVVALSALHLAVQLYANR